LSPAFVMHGIWYSGWHTKPDARRRSREACTRRLIWRRSSVPAANAQRPTPNIQSRM
jgi:hypothetical protein